jgi:[ribosomal protein S5]-alanine N-acetyltransferase
MDDKVLKASLSERWEDAGRLLRAHMPSEMVALTLALAIDQMETEADPAFAAFASRAIIHRESAEVIGHFRFHTRPDPDYLRDWAPDAIEVGYGLFEGWWGQGYGSETLKGAIDWVRDHGARHIIAAVAIGNVASERLTARLGFVRVGETTDPSGGVEAVYCLRL